MTYHQAHQAPETGTCVVLLHFWFRFRRGPESDSLDPLLSWSFFPFDSVSQGFFTPTGILLQSPRLPGRKWRSADAAWRWLPTIKWGLSTEISLPPLCWQCSNFCCSHNMIWETAYKHVQPFVVTAEFFLQQTTSHFLKPGDGPVLASGCITETSPSVMAWPKRNNYEQHGRTTALWPGLGFAAWGGGEITFFPKVGTQVLKGVLGQISQLLGRSFMQFPSLQAPTT